MSLNILLDTLGFSQWKTVIASFALPIISLLSICLCSLSIYIFHRKRFTDSVFFFYRLLFIVYIIHLIMTIPYGLLFSPRYISSLNTYQCSIYHMVYAVSSSFLFHYGDTLQMAILLARTKLFSPYRSSSLPFAFSLIYHLLFRFKQSLLAHLMLRQSKTRRPPFTSLARQTLACHLLAKFSWVLHRFSSTCFYRLSSA